MTLRTGAWHRHGGVIAILGLLCFVPLFVHNPYLLHLFILSMLYAMLAGSWNLMNGYAGIFTFGHQAFFGLGAYASALLAVDAGLSPWITLWFGGGVAALAGFAIGVLLGTSSLSARIASPLLHGTRQIALFAWIPLISAWLGNGEAMKVTLIALSAFFPVFLNVEAGCRQVPLAYREVGRLFGFNRWGEILFIILPAAAPSIIAGLELGFAVAWIGTIGAEYLIGTGYMYASADGIGAFLAGARENARMDLVVVGIASLAVTGFALDRAVVRATGKVLAWRLQSR